MRVKAIVMIEKNLKQDIAYNYKKDYCKNLNTNQNTAGINNVILSSQSQRTLTSKESQNELKIIEESGEPMEFDNIIEEQPMNFLVKIERFNTLQM